MYNPWYSYYGINSSYSSTLTGMSDFIATRLPYSDTIYIADNTTIGQRGFNRFGNGMNWTGSIKGFYYQHTMIILYDDTYEGATRLYLHQNIWRTHMSPP